MLKRIGLVLITIGMLGGCASDASQQPQSQQPQQQQQSQPQLQQQSKQQMKPRAQEVPNSSKPIRTYSTDTPPLDGGNESDTREEITELTLAQLHQKYKSNFIFEGPRSPKRVALTFDDVPDHQDRKSVV